MPSTTRTLLLLTSDSRIFSMETVVLSEAVSPSVSVARQQTALATNAVHIVQ